MRVGLLYTMSETVFRVLRCLDHLAARSFYRAQEAAQPIHLAPVVVVGGTHAVRHLRLPPMSPARWLESSRLEGTHFEWREESQLELLAFLLFGVKTLDLVPDQYQLNRDSKRWSWCWSCRWWSWYRSRRRDGKM